MTWCNVSNGVLSDAHNEEEEEKSLLINSKDNEVRVIICPSCGQNIKLQDQARIHDLPGLPAGVKFDPNDQEILEHLIAKVFSNTHKLHPLIDEFIPTIEGENGICYRHPEKLPGVSKDGQIRHFFHRPSKAYTTGTRKRRKVHTDADHGGETRWHKTGKTRPVIISGSTKGYKKILVLYTNYGRQRKPEKTNWVMHQYHLGESEEEKDGELVVSKVFYQTQPRQCNSSIKEDNHLGPLYALPFSEQKKSKVSRLDECVAKSGNNIDYYNPGNAFMEYNVGSHNNGNRDMVLHGDGSTFMDFSSSASKGK